jgi:hypothetical protein
MKARFWVSFGHVAINEYSWSIDHLKVDQVKRAISRAERAVDTNDEAGGRIAADELERTLQDACGHFFDLVEAMLVYRSGMGSVDKNQRLGNLLEELKQRVRRGENQDGPSITGLRAEVNLLKNEILGGLDQQETVECQNLKCRKQRPKPTQMNPRCPHCGFDPTKVTT